jgi:hypothetical protein
LRPVKGDADKAVQLPELVAGSSVVVSELFVHVDKQARSVKKIKKIL